MPLDILFEDDDFLVINKPANLVTHPAIGHEQDTFVNALLHHCGETLAGQMDPARMGIVHRLDKDTTGVLLAAKNEATQTALSHQFAERQTEKHYIALAYGTPRPPNGTIDQPIGRDPHNRQKMAIRTKTGRPSLTHYETLAAAAETSLLHLHIETGRTHQIRVHLTALGHPICGDALYARARKTPIPFPRQMLHAHTLKIRHPRTHELLAFTAPLPADFRTVLQTLYPQFPLEKLTQPFAPLRPQ